jgi:excisionase family DNA binding protein
METDMTEPVVYTVTQFCAMMQFSRDTFEGLVRRGELAAFKVGRRTYVAKEEAERWFRETRLASHIPSHIQTHGSGLKPAVPSGKRRRQAVAKTGTNTQSAV